MTELNPATTVAEVIARMEIIDAALPPRDGVRCFNHLYLTVTRRVAAALPGVTFEDPAFLARLDVVFANRYFDALRAYERGPGRCPRAWRSLFEARNRPRVQPIRFALAGMNAHINYDLALSLHDVARERGVTLCPDTAWHRDFARVDAILAEVQPAAQRELEGELLLALDDVAGTADDRVAMWSVAKARASAWDGALLYQAVDGIPALFDGTVRTLDRLVSLTSASLLVG